MSGKGTYSPSNLKIYFQGRIDKIVLAAEPRQDYADIQYDGEDYNDSNYDTEDKEKELDETVHKGLDYTIIYEDDGNYEDQELTENGIAELFVN